MSALRGLVNIALGLAAIWLAFGLPSRPLGFVQAVAGGLLVGMGVIRLMRLAKKETTP